MKDKALIKFATAFRDGILDGGSSVWMCFAVCAPLAGLLHAHGVKVELIEADLGACNHVWLRLPDGRALDPTADQFSNYQFAALGIETMELPPVYLGPPLKYHTGEARP